MEKKEIQNEKVEENKTLKGITIKFDDESIQKFKQEFKNTILENVHKSDKLKQIEEILGIEFEPTKSNDGKYSVRYLNVIEAIVNKWKELQEEKQNSITKLLIGDNPEYLIGDTKWVLYQHVISLNDEKGLYTFRCGSFAFDKISKFPDYQKYSGGCDGELNLNGECVHIVKMWNNNFDKKKLIISKGWVISNINDSEKLKKSFTGDIVLYFA